MIKNLQAVADVTKTDRSVVYELTVSGKLQNDCGEDAYAA